MGNVSKLPHRDPYKVLGLKPGAGLYEIERAADLLSRANADGRLFPDSAAARELAEIDRAVAELKQGPRKSDLPGAGILDGRVAITDATLPADLERYAAIPRLILDVTGLGDLSRLPYHIEGSLASDSDRRFQAPQVETVMGDVRIAATWADLSGLKRIGGHCVMFNLANAVFPELEGVGGDFYLAKMWSCNCPKLKRIGSAFAAPVVTDANLSSLRNAQGFSAPRLTRLTLGSSVRDLGKITVPENTRSTIEGLLNASGVRQRDQDGLKAIASTIGSPGRHTGQRPGIRP